MGAGLLTLFAFLELLKQNEGAKEPPLPKAPAPGTPPPVTTATAPPGTAAPMPAWGGAQTPVPATLPSFPGTGWVPDLPLSEAVTNRAAFWNPQLWDVTKKTIVKPMVQEQFGGRWLTFVAAWHPGKDGPQTFMATEAWRLATDQPLPQAPVPVIAPPAPVSPATPGAPVTPTMPGALGPEPVKGAWKTSAAWILKYQTALTFLSKSKSKPAWDPKGVDGKFGPNTQAAVLAFQKDHPTNLKADGQCGTQTAASIDAELGYGQQPAPKPATPAAVPAPVVAPGPAAAMPAAAPPIPVPATPASPAPGVPAGPLPPPAAVSPYPGPGAWQTNAAYIARYQSALTYLAAAHFCPCDPQGVDGKFGNNTKLAVQAFQKEAGLTQDGECGASTATALDQAVHNVASAAPAPVASGEDIGRRHRHKHGKRPPPPAPPDDGGGDGGGDGGDGGGDAPPDDGG
jgi:peptidoglycan hydrolase-like protein with peptidoglycan-binding domain